MIGSVFNFETREFDYFRLPSKSQLGLSFGGPTRPPSGFGSPLGEAPESLAMPLPDGATYIGSGRAPKGIVCRQSSAGLGDITLSTSTTTVVAAIGTFGLLAGAAVGIWALSKSKPGKWLRAKLWG